VRARLRAGADPAADAIELAQLREEPGVATSIIAAVSAMDSPSSNHPSCM